MLQIPDWMDFHADVRPGDTALVTPRLTLSFAQMRATSVAAALELKKRGIKKGQKVAVLAINPGLQFVLFLALQRLGAITCLLPQEQRRREAALAAVEFHFLLTDKDEKPSGVEILSVDLDWLDKLELTRKRLPGGFKRPDEVCLISITSGTTAAPRPMAFSASLMERRVIARSFGEQGGRHGEKTMVQASLGGMNGIVSVLGSLWCGGTAYIGFIPRDSAQVIARERIERLYCPTPLLGQIAETVVTGAMDVSCLKQILYEGDAVSAELVHWVTKNMCPNLVNSFGTNEVSRIALNADPTGFHFGNVGFLYPWAEAEAVDEKDRPLPPGEEGHLRFKSPSMIGGYLGDPQATAERFRKGWFYSDDIGWVTPERQLVISGRASDFIHVKGVGRFNPTRLDHAFSGHPAIAEAAAFGLPGEDGMDEIWLALVPRAAISDAELREFCGKQFGPRAPRRFLRLDRLPRNESAKIIREQLRELARKSAG